MRERAHAIGPDKPGPGNCPEDMNAMEEQTMTAKTETFDTRNFRYARQAIAPLKNRLRGRRFRVRRRPRVSLRDRTLAAFCKIGHGLDKKNAFGRTKDFYRASGADWTRNLT
jgi:hypothetical protein